MSIGCDTDLWKSHSGFFRLYKAFFPGQIQVRNIISLFSSPIPHHPKSPPHTCRHTHTLYTQASWVTHSYTIPLSLSPALGSLNGGFISSHPHHACKDQISAHCPSSLPAFDECAVKCLTDQTHTHTSSPPLSVFVTWTVGWQRHDSHARKLSVAGCL